MWLWQAVGEEEVDKGLVPPEPSGDHTVPLREGSE